MDRIYVPVSLPNQLIDAAKLVISAPRDDARHYGCSPHGVRLTVGIMSRPLMTVNAERNQQTFIKPELQAFLSSALHRRAPDHTRSWVVFKV